VNKSFIIGSGVKTLLHRRAQLQKQCYCNGGEI